MHQTARRSLLPLSLWVGAMLLVVASPAFSPPATAQEALCQGYSGKSLLRGFGGAATFSKEAAESPDDLLRILRHYEADVHSVLDGRDLGHLSEELFRAIETGQGLSERNVQAGETFYWMAFRKRGEPVVLENACYAPRKEKTYPAYVVELTERSEPTGPDCDQVTVTRYGFLLPKICLNLALSELERTTETLEPIPAPVCAVTASRSQDPSRQIRVDATGTSGEVEVSLEAAGSTETVIASGASGRTWSGDDPSPYAEARVVARGENEDRCGRPQSCEETVRLAPYERPSCTITTDPEGEQRAGRPFTLEVDGHWAPGGLEVTVQRGDRLVETLSDDSAAPLAEEMELRPGEYVVTGTATNVIADEATCTATVKVRGQWKIRPHVTYWDVDDDGTMLQQVVILNSAPVSAREKFRVGDGIGVGVGVEYYFTDRIGLEGEIEYTEVETTLVFDRGPDWALDTEDAGTFSLLLGPNVHLTPERRVDFYLGPVVGFVDPGSLDFETFDISTSGSIDSEFVWGGKVGLDVPFGSESRWGFNASARWLDLSPEVELSNPLLGGRFDADIDPITLNIGLVYGF